LNWGTTGGCQEQKKMKGLGGKTWVWTSKPRGKKTRRLPARVELKGFSTKKIKMRVGSNS